MKKIYNILFVVFAFCAFIPFAKAQTRAASDEGYIEKDGLAYSKTISKPDASGVYTITLESFVTGQVKISHESIPADIVLVLDYSGSMKYDMGRDQGNSNARLNAMKEAVNAFIEAIDDNDLNDPETGEARPDRLGNRIAIVTFASSANTRANLTYLSGNGKTSLTNIINGLNNPDGGTQSDQGLTNAYNLLNALGDDRKLRTVVLFTDGDPGNGKYWTSTQQVNSGYGPGATSYTVLTTNGESTWTTANAAINIANNIKGLANTDKGIISNVYTVSIINNPSEYTNVYLGKTSSNWTGATNMAELSTVRVQYRNYTLAPDWNSSNIWANGNGTQVQGANFAFATVDPEELKNIFETIASESGGSSIPLDENTISEVDVVSASFMLPPGADESAIKVYTAPYTGTDASGNHTFSSTETLAPGSTDTYTKKWIDEDGVEHVEEGVDIDNGITVTVTSSSTDPNAKKDQITVNGFDFGNLWCGPDESSSTGYHQGYKLIIKIPIMMDPEAVGGPDVDTNGPGSGIYVNGTNLVYFESPHVSLPVNIHIRKEGLDEGESAKFTIERKYVDDPETAWIPVTSVFVTRHEGDAVEGDNAPITKVMGMPSTDEDDKPYVYRVVENDWSWSYTSGHTTPVSTDLLETNPFIFTNTKKTNIDVKVRHAESKATNTFHPDKQNVKYDDSKARKTN